MSSSTPSHAQGVVTKNSPRSVEQTVDRLTQIVAEKALTLFAVIDHSGAAAKVGLDMPNTKLVVFGSPVAGTPLMVADPLVALDLPLKLLVFTEADGTVSVAYNTTEYLASRYQLSADDATRLAAIEPISDAAVAEHSLVR
jgi:uncharacterized protein (DUF302 family)